MEKVPFDPILGAKILGEIQAEGLRAASSLVERLVHLVDGPADDTPRQPTAEASDPPTSVDMGAVAPWFELWRDLVERTSDLLQRLQGSGAGPTGDGVRIEVDGTLRPARPLVITVDPSGRGTNEMWLHNGTTEDTGELIPTCGPLCDQNGTAVQCEITIDPPRVPGLRTHSSRRFSVAVTTSAATGAGVYRGLIQVRGADALWMPLEVVVSA